MTVENLEKELKEGMLKEIYLLYGEETYLLDTCVKKIRNLFGKLVKGINYIEIDDTNLSQLISDLQTPAFGYPKKLIIVKNTGIFKRELKKKGAAFQELRDKIIDYLKENADILKQDNILIFIEESVDKGKMLSTLEEIGANICNFEYQKMPNIVARLKAICKAYKVNVDDATIKYFVECIGSNMQDLINEIRKQIEYAGENGTITKESIDLLAIKQMESVIFDLTDSLGKKDIKQAMVVLKNLIYAKEPIQKILITLYNHFKKLYITKLAINQNKNIAESLDLKPNQTFLVSKYKTQANYFQKTELKQIIEELINLDTNYKSGMIDLNIGLEAILCTYCS